jgi:hypothetical protein
MLLWLACTTPEAVSSQETQAEAWDVPEPAWNASEVEAEIAAGLALGMPDPITARDSFFGLFTGADGQCPQGSGYSITSFTGCTSSQGYTYAGMSVYQEDGRGGFVLSTDLYIIDASGRRFTGAGQASFGISEYGLQANMDGIWGYEGEEGWLGQIPGFNLSVSLGEDFYLQGGLGIGGHYLAFLPLIQLEGCEGATGILEVRDPGGLWYRLDFGEGCSECAEVSYEGESLGKLCPDLSQIWALKEMQ